MAVDPSSPASAPSATDGGTAPRGALLIVFLTVFIDLLGFGIVLPVMPRQAEPYLDALGLSPLAGGILSGKYLDGKKPAGSRGSINGDIGGRLVPHQEEATRAYVDLAAKHGIDPSAMALAFCLTRPFMASVIIGATTMEQLKINIGAANVSLSDEVLKEIAKIHRLYPMPI